MPLWSKNQGLRKSERHKDAIRLVLNVRQVLELSGTVSENGEEPKVKVVLTHEEIAQLIGASRETVTRTLGDFKKHKLMEFKGATLLIYDRPALEALAAV